MRSRRILLSVMAAGVVCGSSACSVISVGGPPEQVKQGNAADSLSKPFQRMVATEPQPDWDPVRTVKGMQAAMASFDDVEQKILRSYLTPEAKRAWQPGNSVIVVEDNPSYVPVGDDIVQLEANQIAVIHDDGWYEPKREKLTLQFMVAKTPQGYRVSSLRNGLMLLTAADVRRAYAPADIYFLGGSGSQDNLAALPVVDHVWLPINPTRSLAETIVDRLLEGPSESLRGAVSTAFDGLSLDRIATDEETVVVYLEGKKSDPMSVEALKRQLQWSLREVTKGRNIEVRLNGETFFDSAPLTIGSKDSDTWLRSPASKVYFVQNGQLMWLGANGAGIAFPGPVGQLGDTYKEPAITGIPGPAKGDPAEYVAALKSDGRSIWTNRLSPDSQWQEAIKGTNLTPPAWNWNGTLWTVDRIDDHTSYVLRYDMSNLEQEVTRIAAPDLNGKHVMAFKVARDGTRVAAIVADGGAVSVMVGVIAGDRLDHFQTLYTAEKSEEIKDLAWKDSEHLIALVGSSSGNTPREIDISNGQLRELAAHKHITSISALNERLVAGTGADDEGGGKVLELVQDKWADTKVQDGTSSPTFPLD
ncbi:LpqB family beta-propeller domain-containing protein [Nonomuraea sp. NPDC059194]|uniref:LpqB family beta-propeller domain-containing protein n=1 Tax=Nonomuraea sp. NPDC059194 TaxID=3346764 RepID=UPI0036C83F7E